MSESEEADDAALEVEDVDDAALDDFVAEDQLLDDSLDQIGQNIIANLQERRKRCRSFGRRYIPRPREARHSDLYASYFSDSPIYTDEMFRRRFRMNRPLFIQIVEALGNWSSYFTTRLDCTGRESLSLIQKCYAALRMLAYGTPANELDDNLKLAASTS